MVQMVATLSFEREINTVTNSIKTLKIICIKKKSFKKGRWRRLLDGSPVVKTLPRSAGGAGSISFRGAKIALALWQKHKPETML